MVSGYCQSMFFPNWLLGTKKKEEDLTSSLVTDIHIKEPEGDVLIFMTGQVR